jgi:hypothetical protein
VREDRPIGFHFTLESYRNRRARQVIYHLETARSAKIHLLESGSVIVSLVLLDTSSESRRQSAQNDHVIVRIFRFSTRRHDANTETDSATMASQTSGILRWTASIKDSMMNDPGRQLFEDQVQSQGFLFLDEYLDNIWTAAKTE